eukprot:scaffold22381_cov118-Isochrysis_galbana.AAC.9
MLSLVTPCVAGWASISQSVWGAQLSNIQAQLSGGFSSAQTLAVPESQLGYLWSMPSDSSDARGLGGGITWAWDPELCGKMLGSFYQELVPEVYCDDLRAAMRRAFSAWSSESLQSFARCRCCSATGRGPAGASHEVYSPSPLRRRQPRAHLLRRSDRRLP